MGLRHPLFDCLELGLNGSSHIIFENKPFRHPDNPTVALERGSEEAGGSTCRSCFESGAHATCLAVEICSSEAADFLDNEICIVLSWHAIARDLRAQHSDVLLL